MKPTRTGSVTTAVINYLNLIGFFAWENKTVGIYDQKKGIFRKPERKIKGAPDICAIDWFGTFVGIEIKTGKDRLSADQTIFAAEVIGRDGIYIIAESTQDVIDSLIYYGYPLTSAGYAKSKFRYVDWHQAAAVNGNYHIPNANKVKQLQKIEAARISTMIATEDLKTKLAKIFFKYAERIWW
jgi:hypothetical protein